MASISNVILTANINVSNANINVTYQLTGSAFDVTSGQPYKEVVKLISLDPPDGPENNKDIPNGLITDAVVVFSNTTPINRTRSKTMAKADLDEDSPQQQDEIRAIVTLTPIFAEKVEMGSNQVNKEFG